MKKYLKLSVVVSLAGSALLLSACSGNKTAMNNSASEQALAANANYKTGASDSDVRAQTYAAAKAAGYKTDDAGFKVNAMTAPANQTYYFTFDNSEVRAQDMKALMQQANYLVAHPAARVRLEGNTDNRGSREYNIGLGWRRDQAVARLLEQQGVRPSQIQMVSYGKQNPAVMGNNERAWSLNRRVQLFYKK